MSPTARGGGAGRGRSAPGGGAAGLQGHPAVLLPPAGEGQTLADQGLLHLVSAGVDDAGAQEHPILRQQSGDLSGQGDDHVGHDVGQHQMIALPGQPGGQALVGDDVARHHGIPVLADAVEGGVFIGHIHRLGVDVHGHGVAGPQAQGGNGEDAAAAAQVQHGPAGEGVGLHPLQTQLGGGVGAGAEGEAGVEVQGAAALWNGLIPHPLGHYIEAPADLQRFIVLLPAVRPIVVRQGGDGVLRVQATCVLLQLDPAVYDAALDLGCNPRRAFFKVVLPQLTPAILSAFLISLTYSIDDFIISYFTSGTMQTLPIAIYSMTKKKFSPEINALAAIMFVVILTIILAANAVDSAKERRLRRAARAEEGRR